MKDTILHKQAQERMKAGAITAGGFLGSDGRPVAQIVEVDEGAFRKLNLEFDTVADELVRLRDAGGKGLGEPISVDGTWLISVGDARGKLPCPYEDGIHHKNSVWVRRLDSGETLVYSDLSIHMLREHHFCQGEGSVFRLSPDALKRVLGI